MDIAKMFFPGSFRLSQGPWLFLQAALGKILLQAGPSLRVTGEESPDSAEQCTGQ